MSRISQALSMSLHVFAWSVQQDPLEEAALPCLVGTLTSSG